MQVWDIDVDREYGEWLEIQDELTAKPGKPTEELVGRYRKEKELWKASRRPQTRYCQLRFWFCEHVGKALPICAIHRSHLSLHIKLRDLHDCYYSSDGSVPHLIDSQAELSPRDLKVQVFANVYYLSKYERDDMNEGPELEYLIRQGQHNGGQIISCPSSATNAAVIAKLPFQHPVTHIIFTIQPEQHVRQKDFFNWSGRNGEDPLAACKMTIGNRDRFSMREGKWFRLIEPLEHHTNLPKRHIYTYSFALFPEEGGFPSGACNMTDLDVALHLVLQRNLGTCILKVWAQNEQLFRVDPTQGLCGTSFC